MARSADAAVVITSRRGLGKHQEWNPRWKIFDRISNALSDAISVNSNAVGVDTVTRDGVDSKKIICVYNGLDLSRFGTPQHTRDLMRRQLHLSGGEFAWVKVANLIDYKGHQDLLLAFAELLKTRPARLFLVGRDRGSQGSLESATALLGIADRVHFLGDCGNVPEILSAMDGYVMASHTEGFSNAILEAMAAGLPIIATAVGGNVEALQNGKLGFLVEPHDPTALAGAMSQMMINQPLRENLSILAAKTVRERYSVKAMVESYIRLYQGEFNR
jgi:glycosyltransferase involved in cell wall biosynthesis